jgi:hypothetical protein
MVQLAHGAGLLFEALQPGGIGGERGRQDLDGDKPADRRIARPVDLGEPPVAE